jgi:hypothetical protein
MFSENLHKKVVEPLLLGTHPPNQKPTNDNALPSP